MCIFQYKRNVTVSQEISIMVLLVIIGSIQKYAEKLHFLKIIFQKQVLKLKFWWLI